MVCLHGNRCNALLIFLQILWFSLVTTGHSLAEGDCKMELDRPNGNYYARMVGKIDWSTDLLPLEYVEVAEGERISMIKKPKFWCNQSGRCWVQANKMLLELGGGLALMPVSIKKLQAVLPLDFGGFLAIDGRGPGRLLKIDASGKVAWNVDSRDSVSFHLDIDGRVYVSPSMTGDYIRSVNVDNGNVGNLVDNSGVTLIKSWISTEVSSHFSICRVSDNDGSDAVIYRLSDGDFGINGVVSGKTCHLIKNDAISDGLCSENARKHGFYSVAMLNGSINLLFVDIRGVFVVSITRIDFSH